MSYRKLPVRWIFKLWNFWFPFLGAGITLHKVSDDLRFVQTRLRLRFWNQNYVGTQYGGSMFSMTDPIYMVMLIQNLGSDYIVWDKAATIRYLKPGKTDVFADFRLTEEILNQIRETVEAQGKMDWTTTVQIKDKNGELIAEVDKVLYIRKKKPKS
jgi:acyl-coenzyme A thioesterase PaaI-like protein